MLKSPSDKMDRDGLLCSTDVLLPAGSITRFRKSSLIMFEGSRDGLPGAASDIIHCSSAASLLPKRKFCCLFFSYFIKIVFLKIQHRFDPFGPMGKFSFSILLLFQHCSELIISLLFLSTSEVSSNTRAAWSATNPSPTQYTWIIFRAIDALD